MGKKAADAGQQHGPDSHERNPSRGTEAPVVRGSLWSKHSSYRHCDYVTKLLILRQRHIHFHHHKHVGMLRKLEGKDMKMTSSPVTSYKDKETDLPTMYNSTTTPTQQDQALRMVHCPGKACWGMVE